VVAGYDSAWPTYDGGGASDTYDAVPDLSGYRLRVDVYNASGTKLNFGAIIPLRGAYNDALDGIGGFSLECAADDEKVTYLAVGYEVYIYRENEGLVFRGVINRIQRVVAADGRLVAKISGASIARQLVWKNTLLGLQLNNVTLASALSTLLTGTGWSTGSVDVPSTNVTARRYDGNNIAAALMNIAELFQYHTRFDFLTKTVDVAALGASSGLTFMNVENVGPNLYSNGLLYPIQNVEVLSEGDDLWNSIIPLGGGEGINQLSLKYAGTTVGARDQTSPYTISSATGPDGETYYYLEDSASVTAYGRRQKVIVAKDVVPIAQSDTGLKNAANALYQIGATWLQRHKDPPTSYNVTVTGLTHLDSGGTQKFQVGDKIRLIYNGWVKESDGTRRAWLNVDTSLWVMAYARTFDDSGIDTWQITISTVDRQEETLSTKIAALTADMLAVKTAMHPYTHEVTHTLGQRSIAASQPQSIKVIWDANVQYLHKSKLYFYIRALRSNVTANASESAHAHMVAKTTGSAATTIQTGQPSATTTVVNSATSTGSATAITGLATASNASGNAHTHNLNGHIHALTGGAAVTHTHPHGDPTTGVNGAGNTAAETAGANDATGVPGSVTASGDSSVADNKTYVTGSSSTASVSTGVSSGTTTVGSATHTHTQGGYRMNIKDGSGTDREIQLAYNVTALDWWSQFDASSAHTHGLTYGIYVDPSPTSVAAVQIWINGSNRTVALGGPWSTRDSLNTIDITQYLQSQTGATGTPNQSTNTVEFRYGAVDGLAIDIEATMRTLITSMSILPV
jgi:hypothetical protein